MFTIIKDVNIQNETPIIKIQTENTFFTMFYTASYDYYIEMISLEDKLNASPIIIIPKDENIYNSFNKLYEDIKERNLKYDLKPFKENKVVWESDDYPKNEGDVLKIYKDKDRIYLEIVPNFPDKTFGIVHIRTSGSRYGDYYQNFRNLYNDLNNLQKGKNKQKKLK